MQVVGSGIFHTIHSRTFLYRKWCEAPLRLCVKFHVKWKWMKSSFIFANRVFYQSWSASVQLYFAHRSAKILVSRDSTGEMSNHSSRHLYCFESVVKWLAYLLLTCYYFIVLLSLNSLHLSEIFAFSVQCMYVIEVTGAEWPFVVIDDVVLKDVTDLCSS